MHILSQFQTRCLLERKLRSIHKSIICHLAVTQNYGKRQRERETKQRKTRFPEMDAVASNGFFGASAFFHLTTLSCFNISLWNNRLCFSRQSLSIDCPHSKQSILYRVFVLYIRYKNYVTNFSSYSQHNAYIYQQIKNWVGIYEEFSEENWFLSRKNKNVTPMRFWRSFGVRFL